MFYFYWVLFLREKEKRKLNRGGRTYTRATLYFLVIFSYFIVWLNTGIPVASFINYHISLFKSTCKRQNRAASGVYIMQARRRNGGIFFNQHWNTSDTYNYSLCQMDHSLLRWIKEWVLVTCGVLWLGLVFSSIFLYFNLRPLCLRPEPLWTLNTPFF